MVARRREFTVGESVGNHGLTITSTERPVMPYRNGHTLGIHVRCGYCGTEFQMRLDNLAGTYSCGCRKKSSPRYAAGAGTRSSRWIAKYEYRDRVRARRAFNQLKEMALRSLSQGDDEWLLNIIRDGSVVAKRLGPEELARRAELERREEIEAAIVKYQRSRRKT